MSSSTHQIAAFEEALLANASDYNVEFSANVVGQLALYYQLINKWNPRLHLVAPCSAEEFATRHILESLLLLPYLPNSARVIDIGSGAGLPIIPCLILREDICAVMIEAAQRKAVFLREALNLIGRATSNDVIAERFETVIAPPAQFITSRALDRFGSMLPKLVNWAPNGCTMLLFGGEELEKTLNARGLAHKRIQIPNSLKRFLFVTDVASTYYMI